MYRRRRIWAGIAALLAIIVVVGGSYTVVTLSRTPPAAAATLSIPSSLSGTAADLSLPSDGSVALGASGFDGVIASSGSQSAAPIASISKVITALVILNQKPLSGTDQGSVITYGASDVAIYQQVIAEDGSNAPVSDGLQLTERQSLTTMLLPSANNYAISLANWAFGSQDAFVTAATSWLQAHGLSDTHLVEPSGLSPQNVSTPANLVTIGQIALANPVLASIVSLTSADIPGVGTLTNTNTLLGSLGINGVKTGTTGEAGYCLLFSSNFTVGTQQVTVVGVLLGASSEDSLHSQVTAFLKSAQSAFHDIPITTAGATVGQLSTVWGAHSDLRAAADAHLVSFGDQAVTVEQHIAPISSGAAGAQAGTLTARSGNQSVEIQLQLGTALAGPSAWWKLSHPNQLH